MSELAIRILIICFFYSMIYLLKTSKDKITGVVGTKLYKLNLGVFWFMFVGNLILLFIDYVVLNSVN